MNERALRITLDDYISSLSHLVTLLNERTIHQRCINLLIIEVFKYRNGLLPDLINEIFRLKSNFENLRNFNQFIHTFQKLSHCEIQVSIEQINNGS